MTPPELKKLGWDKLDVILVTGDAYIDSPYIGAAIIGKLLLSHGYRVGVISQPDIHSTHDIAMLGEPALFWGVTGGSIDSMVANYTASNKRRKSDDLTPGGANNRRPDRAVIAYSNLIRRQFKNTAPIVLGGIEASLRRIAHYDYWSNKVRRSVLFDAKADYLVYGMGEKTTLALASALAQKKTTESQIRGLCYISREKTQDSDFIELPSFEAVSPNTDAGKKEFTQMFREFYDNNDGKTAHGLLQKTGDRWLVHNPPMELPTSRELDSFHMPAGKFAFERKAHPSYEKQGLIRALHTISFSIPTHRGCYGECNYCAIGVHQGRTVVSRSEASILSEAKEIRDMPSFKGTISDAGGPTANMYGFECSKKLKAGACPDKRCLFPKTCPTLKTDHSAYTRLLKKIREIPGINHVFVASGIRYDLVDDDNAHGVSFVEALARFHTSGQIKVAPEHMDDKILNLMGKPPNHSLDSFRSLFGQASHRAGKNQFLTYYFIAAHPGCGNAQMDSLRRVASERLSIHPEQVQIFTPTPSTWSTLMYYTECNPFSGEKLFVEKNVSGRVRQKEILVLKKTGGATRRLVRKNPSGKIFRR